MIVVEKISNTYIIFRVYCNDCDYLNKRLGAYNSTYKNVSTFEPITFEWFIEQLKKQNFTCNMCYDRLEETAFQFDHIIPASKDKSTASRDNIQILCTACNFYKRGSDKTFRNKTTLMDWAFQYWEKKKVYGSGN